jgi:hypothetical protein
MILVLAPAAVQLLEFLVHLFANTPNFKTGVFISTGMTALASLFNWYSMRQGMMLTGREARPFSADLNRFSALVHGFVTTIPLPLRTACGVIVGSIGQFAASESLAPILRRRLAPVLLGRCSSAYDLCSDIAAQLLRRE